MLQAVLAAHDAEPDAIPPATLEALDTCFELSKTRNSEVQVQLQLHP